MRILFIIFLALLFSGFTRPALAQKEEVLVLAAKIANIPANTGLKSSHAYHMVDYEVLSVCAGGYDDKTIKVAHQINVGKDLRVGETVYLKVKRTDAFRIMARFLLEDVGYVTPPDFMTDFMFEEFGRSCTDLQ